LPKRCTSALVGVENPYRGRDRPRICNRLQKAITLASA
jgi:hypothetical protein